MIANTRLFWVLSGFFLVASIAYTIWSYVYYADAPSELQNELGIEWVGSIGLLLSSTLAALIAFYLGRLHKAQGAELPEDRLDSNIDDGDAEQGFFSPWSWWPIVLAAGASLLFVGIAVGVWIAFIGAGLTVIALVGWMFEYYRGNFAR
ncbi:cytochrome c oxidase subunit 4 [Marisediminicola senii]|uniref:cytochrome c oxidase subunit 4 n=1 Tax=Marisediminicola senii TaxID=2711233 RepID=UPI0013ED4405|nr:cytochrome c oxidase subunit 4 [Marisediminicola senii]